MDLEQAVLYRMAYGLAFELHEAREHRFPGRYAGNAAAGGTVEAILAEVLRQLAITDHVLAKVARDAVEDVMGGRRPRW